MISINLFIDVFFFFIIFLVAFVFGIIFPVYNDCVQANNGLSNYSCQELAWYTAIASNFITGVIILILCLFGEFIRRNVPSVALLSSLSAVGFTYLALGQYLSIAATPIVSFLPFAIVMTGYFSGSKSVFGSTFNLSLILCV